MDVVQGIEMVLSVAKEIFDIVQKVQSFKHRSRRLSKRIEGIVPAIEKLASSENNVVVRPSARGPDEIKLFSQNLGELRQLLEKVRDFLESLKKKNFRQKFLYNNEIGGRFDEYNEQFDALIKDTHFSVLVEMREVMYDRLKEDEEDQRKDIKELIIMIEKLYNIEKGQDEIKDKLEEIKTQFNQSSRKDECNFSRDRTQVDEVKHIDRNQLTERRKISAGQFWKVYEAKHMKETVALKIFLDGVNVEKEVIHKEAKNLLHLESRHVVRLWGVCIEQKPFIIVLDYMERGNLRDVLDEVSANDLPWQRRIQMALDGSLGLYRIHHMPHPMLHRDLASSKFLVNSNWEVKISDVGFAETQSSILKKSKLTRSGKSNLHYLCPQRLDDANIKPLQPSEVYSYGIIMWEIATGLQPYKGYTDSEIDDFVLVKKNKLPLPADCPDGFKTLIDKCREFEPIDRPTAGEIVDHLQNLRSSMEASRGVTWV